MPEIPSVRIELEHMKHTVLHAFPRYLAEIDEQTRIAINKAVASFDYEAELKKVVHDVLRREIESALRNAAHELMRSPEFAEIAKQALVRSLRSDT